MLRSTNEIMSNEACERCKPGDNVSVTGTIVKAPTRDYEIMHHTLDAEAKAGKHLVTVPDPDEFKWADDLLINDATLTNDAKIIATGDDYGCVSLHNYLEIEINAMPQFDVKKSSVSKVGRKKAHWKVSQ